MFIIYYKPGCPHSEKAYNLLKNNKLNYIKYDLISSNNEDNNIRDIINKKYNHRTLPAIFVSNDSTYSSNKLNIDDKLKFIGGCAEFTEMYDIIKNLKNDSIKDDYMKNKNIFNNISYHDYLKMSSDILNKK